MRSPWSPRAGWMAGVAAFILATGFLPRDARAGDELDVVVAGGEVTMTARGEWHINVDYPWKAWVDGAKAEQAKFTLSEKRVVVRDAPHGTVTIRGGVCGEGRCRAFSRDIVVQ